ncbi:hypothetical protein BACI349Y_70009 [Bacillus sp. 349Y]|nr:hypothetical protein BACI349Y_70009 [Bacillus sp. 349Y]
MGGVPEKSNQGQRASFLLTSGFMSHSSREKYNFQKGRIEPSIYTQSLSGNTNVDCHQ